MSPAVKGQMPVSKITLLWVCPNKNCDEEVEQPLGLVLLARDEPDHVFVAADVANKNEVVLTGREFVLAQNSGATPRTITFTSVIDDLNRYGDITAYSIEAGETAIFGPFPKRGWAQASNSKLYFEATHIEVLFAIVVIPTL